MVQRVTRGTGLLEGFLSKKRAKIANSLINESSRNGRILDIGCGTFPFFLINTKFKEKHGLDQVLSSHKGLLIKKLDLKRLKLPYKSRSFDAVTMLAVLEHLTETEGRNIIKESSRILKTKGRIIITTPSPLGQSVLKVMAKLNLVSKEEIEEHKTIYSLEELRNIINENNLKVIKAGRFELFMNNYLCAEKIQ